MLPEINEQIINYAQITILVLYGLKGLFRSTSKSIFSLILFPVSIMAYVFLAKYLAGKVIIPVSFFGVFKVIIASLFIVSIARIILSLIFGAIFKEDTSGNYFVRIIKRIPGSVISSFQGALLILCIFWTVEYFDVVFLNKYSDVYNKISENHIFKAVSKINPIYDIKGSKNLKIVMVAFSKEEYAKKITESRYLQSFYELPVIKNILNDSAFQSTLKEGQIHKVLMHSLIRDFLSSENVFKYITSDLFLNECRSSLPSSTLKSIDSKEGIFSGINFKIPKDEMKSKSSNIINNKVKVILHNGFIFEGEIIERNQKGIRLKMEEGEMFFKVEEVLRVENNN